MGIRRRERVYSLLRGQAVKPLPQCVGAPLDGLESRHLLIIIVTLGTGGGLLKESTVLG